MTEAPVLGEIGHGTAVVDDHVQVRQGAQQCAGEQGRATECLAGNRTGNGGAESGLGNGIHESPRQYREGYGRYYALIPESDHRSGGKTPAGRPPVQSSQALRRRVRPRPARPRPSRARVPGSGTERTLSLARRSIVVAFPSSVSNSSSPVAKPSRDRE